jgi:SAM-dependent methyltransferase
MPSFAETMSAPEINSDSRTLKQSYLRVPARQAVGTAQKLTRALTGAALAIPYWMLAILHRGPGLRFRRRCFVLGLQMLFQQKVRLSLSTFYQLFFCPIDSVRYFEFDFMWEALSRLHVRHYLDVSSPRLLPVIFLRSHPDTNGELVNPDETDLRATETLVTASEFDSRCGLRNCRIEHAPFAPGWFDAVTSISVIEHIPDCRNAIHTLWELLQPGGTLLLSVPCAAVAEEEHINRDFYGLQTPDGNGFFFHQYKFDQALLEERIYRVTGPPARLAIFGEKRAGTLLGWLCRRWTGQKYPLWKEPYAMAREFQYYEALSDLPGDGVIAMEFVKK